MGFSLLLNVLDWFFVFIVCRVFKRHMWIWRENLYVPYYGRGHMQCVDCKTIKLDPLR